MLVAKILALAALAGAAAVYARSSARPVATVALVASAALTLFAFGIVHLAVRGVDIHLLLGLLLAGAGLLAWFRTTARVAVTGATIVAVVGALEVLQRL